MALRALLVQVLVVALGVQVHYIAEGGHVLDLVGDDDDNNYTLVFTGGRNGSEGQRFAFESGIALASAGYNSTVSTNEALRRCEALCTSHPCCVGLTLTDETWGHRCFVVNATDSVRTGLSCVSYERPPTASCERAPLAAPAPIRFPIRGWSITCDQGNPNRSVLYPGVNLLTEGANTRELPALYRDEVAVLARRDVEQPFALGAPCRFNHSTGREACINLLAEQYRTTDVDEVGVPVARWSGVGLDECVNLIACTFICSRCSVEPRL